MKTTRKQEIRNTIMADAVAKNMDVDTNLFSLVDELKVQMQADVVRYDIVCRNKEEFRNVINNELYLSGFNYMANKIEFDEKEGAKVEMQDLSRGELSRAGSYEEGAVFKNGIKLSDNYRYKKDMLVVSYKKDSEAKKLANRNGILVQHRADNQKIKQVFTIAVNEAGVLVLNPQIKTRRGEAKQLFGTEAEQMMAKCIHYRCFSASQSQERKVEEVYTSWGVTYSLAVKCVLSGGHIEEQFYINKGEISYKNATKYFKRDAFFNSTMMEIGELKEDTYGALITFGNFIGNKRHISIEEDYNRLVEMGYNQTDDTKDGIGFYDRAMVANMLYIKYGIVVRPSDIDDMQVRIKGIAAKNFGLLEDAEVMTEMKQNIMDNGTEVTMEEVQRRIDEARKTGKGLKFDSNEYVIVGNRNKVGVLLDGNGSKYFTANGTYTIHLLDLARTKNYVNLSWQAYNKLDTFISDSTREALIGGFVDDIAKETMSILTPSNPTLVGNNSTVAFSLSDKAKTVYENYVTLLGDTTQTIFSKIEKCKVKVDGIYTRVAFEASDMLSQEGFGILNGGGYYLEVFNPLMKDGEFGLALKFPCPTKYEYVLTKNIGLKTIVERVDMKVANSEITRNQGDLIIKHFKNKGDATLVMAQEDSIKHRLAGMDTDYDGIQIIRDKNIVADAVAYCKAQGHSGLTTVIAK